MRPALVLALALAAALAGCVSHTDPELADRVRAEVKEWLAAVPLPSVEANGAVSVLRGAGRLEKPPARLVREDFDPSAEEDAKLLEAYLARNAEALADIEKGLEAAEFAYTTDFDRGIRATIPSLAHVRNAMIALNGRGHRARARGDAAQACTEYLKTLRLGASMQGHEFLITRMMASAVESAGFRAIWRIFQTPPPPEVLATLLEGMKTLHGMRQPLAEALDTEYYCFQMTELARAAAGESDFKSDYRKDYEMFRKWREIYGTLDATRYWEIPAEVREGRVEDLLASGETSGADFANVAIPSLTRCYVSAAEVECLWRGAILMGAILLHQAREGALPASLAALGAAVPEAVRTDPFSGKDFVYRIAGEDFWLYGAGANGKDDGGRAPLRFDERSDPDEVLLDAVFHRPR